MATLTSKAFRLFYCEQCRLVYTTDLPCTHMRQPRTPWPRWTWVGAALCLGSTAVTVWGIVELAPYLVYALQALP